MIFTPGIKMLELEEKEDDELRAKHGAKWTRSSSSDINKQTKVNFASHQCYYCCKSKDDAVLSSIEGGW